jgi:hypothetical protein
MLLLRATSPLRPSLLTSTLTSGIPFLLSRPLSSATTRVLPRPASFLFRRPARPLAVAFGLSIPLFAPSRPTLNDSSPAALGDGASFSSSSSVNGKKDVPVLKDGSLNPSAIRQISMGGLLGLGAGVLLSMLSRVLVLALGVGIVVWQVSEHENRSRSRARGREVESVWTKTEADLFSAQYAARRGYNIIPAERLQRYVKGIDVRSAIHDNVAFKISFGLVFALTAFGEF